MYIPNEGRSVHKHIHTRDGSYRSETSDGSHMVSIRRTTPKNVPFCEHTHTNTPTRRKCVSGFLFIRQGTLIDFYSSGNCNRFPSEIPNFYSSGNCNRFPSEIPKFYSSGNCNRILFGMLDFYSSRNCNRFPSEIPGFYSLRSSVSKFDSWCEFRF